MAKQEQDIGNYPYAHSVLTEIIMKLEEVRAKVPMNMRQAFVLLHSYMLVKIFARRGDHTSMARLLLRLAQNISRFPNHTVQILLSTVIECQRAGLKSSSYEHATTLMRPEYRQQITDQLLRKKIEAIVRRKSAQSEEVPEDLTPCPISAQLILASQLECPTTRDALPMCVITGRHVLLDDFCICPNSKFPAIHSEYVKYIQGESERIAAELAKKGDANGASVDVMDPVLGLPIVANDLKLSTKEEVLKYIQRYNNIIDKSEEVVASDEANAGATKGKSKSSSRSSKARSNGRSRKEKR